MQFLPKFMYGCIVNAINNEQTFLYRTVLNNFREMNLAYYVSFNIS